MRRNCITAHNTPPNAKRTYVYQRKKEIEKIKQALFLKNMKENQNTKRGPLFKDFQFGSPYLYYSCSRFQSPFLQHPSKQLLGQD